MVEPVLVISIDGVAPQYVGPATMPALCRLARSGAATFDARTVHPSITLPAHTSMLRGVDPQQHGIFDNEPLSLDHVAPSFLKQARQAGLTTAAVLNWPPMHGLVETDATTARFDQAGGYAPAEDRLTTTTTCNLIDLGHDVTFSYIVAPDLLGHEYGWGSPQYLDALRVVDVHLDEILTALGDTASVLVTTDHGGEGNDHQASRPVDMRTFLVLRTATTPPATLLRTASILDVAPTVAELAGFDTHPDWVGTSLVGAGEPFVDHVLDLVASMADHHYGEDVTMLAHSLQTAACLRERGATEDLVLAGLLHDLGHLLGDAGQWGLPDHASVGAEFLRPWLPESVVEPIRLHVDAKRQLVATQPGYELSVASQETLRQQGGPFTPEQVDAFNAEPWAEDALALRQADDDGKVLGTAVPDLAHWRPVLARAVTTGIPDARALRDGCSCPACRDETSGQRLLSAAELEGWRVAGRTLTGWRLRHEDGTTHEVHPSSPRPTSVPISFPVAPAVRALPAELDAFRSDLATAGIALGEGLGTAEGAVLDLASTLGFVRETNYGELFDVRTEPAAANLAYTSLGLALHTDNPYRDPVPTVQLLHCLRSAEEGGASMFRDGFAAANDLRRADPEAFAGLSGTPVQFEYRSAEACLQAQRPIIELDAAGSVVAVAVNHRSMVAPLTREPGRWYDAYQAFVELLADPAEATHLRLSPGQVVAFDNRRVLHGRAAFSSSDARHLQGCYIDIDAVRSAVAVASG